MNNNRLINNFFAQNITLRKSDLENLAISRGIVRNHDEFENIYKTRAATRITDPVDWKINFKIEEYPGYYMMDIIFWTTTDNIEYILFMLVHVVSRKVWLYRIQSKSAAECKKAFLKMEKEILNVNQRVRNLNNHGIRKYWKWYIDTILCDKESAFRHGLFRDLLERRDVKIVHKDTDEHRIMGILDHVVQVMKRQLDTEYLTFQENRIRGRRRNNIMPTNNDIDDMIKQAVDNYNNTQIKRIYNFTPNYVFYGPDIQNKIYQVSVLINNIKVLKQRMYEAVGEDNNIQPNMKVRRLDRRTNRIDYRRKYFSNEWYKVHHKNNFSYNLRRNNRDTGKRYKRYELRKVLRGEVELQPRIRH